MMLTNADAVEAWLHDRGGMAEGLPLLRSMVKGGRVSVIEIDVIKEYLADLDGPPLLVPEPASSAEPAGAQPADAQPRDRQGSTTDTETGPRKRSGNLAVVVAVMLAALAATLVAVR